MQYFTKDFLDFFKDLSANNHKDWFDENRKRYEAEIKKPFEVFTQDAIDALAKVNPELASLDYKKCIFRINRDIRFSKDKSPYKTNMSGYYKRAGASRRGSYFFSIEPGGQTLVGGGFYGPNKEDLFRIRKEFEIDGTMIDKITSDKSFIINSLSSNKGFSINFTT